MSFYTDRVLPYLVHASMRQETFEPYRRRVVSSATGRVLEIGVGSGLNLPFYGERSTTVIGLDPSARLLSMARHAAATSNRPIELIDGSAEDIPLPDEAVDSVVSTWTLCTIPDVTRALREMHRVLKPGGQLLFAEHGRSTDPGVCRWQDRLTPLWKHVAGGCHLNRPIEQLIQCAGFQIRQMHTGYMRGPKPMTFIYEGGASRS